MGDVKRMRGHTGLSFRKHYINPMIVEIQSMVLMHYSCSERSTVIADYHTGTAVHTNDYHHSQCS